MLDFAFLTGPSGNFAGGFVNDGLLPGGSASFTVTGAAFSGFTEEDIEKSIFVRFLNVPTAAGTGGDVGVVTSVPEPSSIVLLATALVGVGGLVRRKRRRVLALIPAL